MCSFAEQTFVDPGLPAGCRAWCWGYRVEEGVSLARELQCWRRQVISRCRRYSPQVKDADRATGPARGAEGESWEGFMMGQALDLGLAESTGKTWAVGRCSPFRAHGILGVLFPMTDGRVPSCPSGSSFVTQDLILGSCHRGAWHGGSWCGRSGDGERVQ